MFIRFVWDRPHPTVPAEAGMFDAYWRVRETAVPEPGPSRGRRGRNPCVDRVRRRHALALRAAATPFNRLRMPVFAGSDRVRGARGALFWFPADAAWPGQAKGTVVMDAWGLVHELARWGIEIRTIESRDPGRLLWSDPHQVLAMPEAPVPRAFR